MNQGNVGTPAGRRHAVVIGASMAGLMSARVLADHFESVTVLERDALPDELEPRKGVPQGRQTHVLPSRGTGVLDKLFPGFWQELVEQGATPIDGGNDMLWFQNGGWKIRAPGPTIYGSSRPMLELHARRRLQKAYPQVSFRRADVKGLLHDASQRRVTGVRLLAENQQESTLEADFVVDASGRGTRTPRWLEELGYGAPPEEHVRMDMCYATRVVEPPQQERDWKGMIVFGKAPEAKRLGYIFPIEHGQWSVTLAGYHGDHPPADEAGFLEFARSVHHPAYFAALQGARPLSPIHVYKIPSDQRYYYERMEHFPEGLVVIGDAICSYNPTFGQGITTAALGAETLDECLNEAKAAPSKKGFSLDFQKRTTRFNNVAWGLATGEDLRYPETQGQRPFGLKFTHWYTKQLMELCAADEVVMKSMLEVQHMLAGPEKLMAPGMVLKAIRWSLGLRGKHSRLSDQPPRSATAAR